VTKGKEEETLPLNTRKKITLGKKHLELSEIRKHS